ncbi:MAG: TRAP transporter large permease, partial [Betaproteobacteria bacterium]
MSSEAIGAIGLVVMLGLLALRMPIGIAMFLVGSVGFAVLNGPQAALMALGTYPYSYAAYYDLAVIPLFVLMGSIASACGMGQSLFAAAYAWVGHWRGGLASATILSCAGFAAVSGSSVASAVTMGRVCLPEMRRYRYDSGLAAGTVAAGGTLGILIPPSTAFVIYGILTEQSIGKLLLAGVLPGLLLTLLFVITIMIWTGLQPNLGPAGERSSFAQRWRALGQSAPMLGLVFASIGGIYAGVFTPAEAAAVGAFLALAWAWITGHLSRAVLEEVLLDTVRTTAMVFLILMGALVFGPFLALSGLPTQVADLLTGTSLSSFAV